MGPVPAAEVPRTSSDPAFSSPPRSAAVRPFARAWPSRLRTSAASRSTVLQSPRATSFCASARLFARRVGVRGFAELSRRCGAAVRVACTRGASDDSGARRTGVFRGAASVVSAGELFAAVRRFFGAATGAGFSGSGGISICDADAAAACVPSWLAGAHITAIAALRSLASPAPFVQKHFLMTALCRPPAYPPALACGEAAPHRDTRSRKFPAALRQ